MMPLLFQLLLSRRAATTYLVGDDDHSVQVWWLWLQLVAGCCSSCYGENDVGQQSVDADEDHHSIETQQQQWTFLIMMIQGLLLV